MDHQHKAHLTQANKPNKKNRTKSGGRVETKSRSLLGGAGASGSALNKEQRFNQMNEARKLKREELIMARRGLNFMTDAVADRLDDEQITVVENEVDNIAPKVVGILGLSSSCDVQGLRKELVKHCVEYQQQIHKTSDKEAEQILAADNQFRAYLCPNPGSSTNMGSKKQRLIFIEIDRNDELAVLEAGKIVDIMIVIMSCKETEIQGLKIDPDKNSHAIDEVGYKALPKDIELQAFQLITQIGPPEIPGHALPHRCPPAPRDSLQQEAAPDQKTLPPLFHLGIHRQTQIHELQPPAGAN